jgi:hypothetical protein
MPTKEPEMVQHARRFQEICSNDNQVHLKAKKERTIDDASN